MKANFILVLALVIMSSATGQELHSEVTTEEGLQFLIGPINTELLQKDPYQEWFESNYKEYQTSGEEIDKLAKALQKHNVLIFLGTWCGDSRREVPRFLKILDEAQFPNERLKIVAVDRREPNIKKSPMGEEWGLQIKRVPTFIFLKDGKEVNRIVESPVESLEKDMITLLGKKEYTPNYADLMKSE